MAYPLVEVVSELVGDEEGDLTCDPLVVLPVADGGVDAVDDLGCDSPERLGKVDEPSCGICL